MRGVRTVTLSRASALTLSGRSDTVFVGERRF